MYQISFLFTLIWHVTTCIKIVQVNSLSFFIRHVAIAIAVGWSQEKFTHKIIKTRKWKKI